MSTQSGISDGSANAARRTGPSGGKGGSQVAGSRTLSGMWPTASVSEGADSS